MKLARANTDAERTAAAGRILGCVASSRLWAIRPLLDLALAEPDATRRDALIIAADALIASTAALANSAAQAAGDTSFQAVESWLYCPRELAALAVLRGEGPAE